MGFRGGAGLLLIEFLSPPSTLSGPASVGTIRQVLVGPASPIEAGAAVVVRTQKMPHQWPFGVNPEHFRAACGNTMPDLPRITSGRIFDLPSNPLNLNPQRMLLDLGYRQDFVLLLFGDLKGIGARDALTFRMDGQGQGQSI